MTIQTSCRGCRDGAGFDQAITMAFQPILNIRTGQVFAQEALVRGADGAGAGEILALVTDGNRYAFDQLCRTTAIELAAGLGLPESGAALSVNFLPNAVYEPRACIRLTLATALRHGLPLDQIIFEFTEAESVDTAHLLNILRAYKAMGFKTAIDDFGAGYAGLGLLSKFQPDIVKIDMELVRGLDADRTKRTILRGTLRILAELHIATVCEGVETQAEYAVLRDMGVELMQGYLIGRPALRALTHPTCPPPPLPWSAQGGGPGQPSPRMAHGVADH